MTWIALSMRKMQLKQEVSALQFNEVQISQKIQALSKYANNIADGTITFAEMADCPSDFFGTQLDFIQNSSQAAYQSATIKTNAAIQQLAQTNSITGNQYGYAMGTTDATAYDQATLFNEIYKEELKKFAEQMQGTLNEYEEQLNEEKEQVETQLQAKQAELDALKQEIGQNIKDDAINFGR